MKRIFAVVLACCLALPAFGDVVIFADLSVTATSGTTAFGRLVKSVAIRSDSTSANDAYVRLFSDVDTVGAATTANGMRIQPGEILTFYLADEDMSPERGSGYVAVSYVCDTAETATVRVYAQ